jgi:hypothetical protein
MKQNQIEEGRFSEQGRGLGTATEDMVRKRAGEIAVINGRSKNNILKSDWDQARRELTGREGLAPASSKAENLPEDKRWDPVPGSEGRRGEPTVPAHDEQTVAEKLVEEGVADAEHDQMTQATRESLKRETETE